MIKAYLKDIKKIIVEKGFQFIKREKNVKFLREYGLLIEDVKKIILSLKPEDYIKGPEKDHNQKYLGDIWVFKNTTYLDMTIYIKIRYNPPDEVVCISFHEDMEE
ncbi:MAG: type II toxin-antitoxin system MqsR family toxin [Caloramator sp.]|nr:type II toxin-antitoxin system MqsR family toxin [Caloramator sp.]